jgi:hypothetical protein
MMHGDGKSGSAIVAMKPTNKAEQPAARSSPRGGAIREPVEPRARRPSGMRASKARVGHSTARACHKSQLVCGAQEQRSRPSVSD